jgi:hypothetical protein
MALKRFPGLAQIDPGVFVVWRELDGLGERFLGVGQLAPSGKCHSQIIVSD